MDILEEKCSITIFAKKKKGFIATLISLRFAILTNCLKLTNLVKVLAIWYNFGQLVNLLKIIMMCYKLCGILTHRSGLNS